MCLVGQTLPPPPCRAPRCSYTPVAAICNHFGEKCLDEMQTLHCNTAFEITSASTLIYSQSAHVLRNGNYALLLQNYFAVILRCAVELVFCLSCRLNRQPWAKLSTFIFRTNVWNVCKTTSPSTAWVHLWHWQLHKCHCSGTNRQILFGLMSLVVMQRISFEVVADDTGIGPLGKRRLAEGIRFAVGSAGNKSRKCSMSFDWALSTVTVGGCCAPCNFSRYLPRIAAIIKKNSQLEGS